MIKIRIALVTALVLCAFIPVSAAQAAEYKCTNTLAQYTEALPQIEVLAARATIKADENPLYISDAQYYASILRDAKRCIVNLSPVTTAAR
jgi:hypothetical protein